MTTNYCRCRIPQIKALRMLNVFSFAKEKMEIDKRDCPHLYRTQKLRLSVPMVLGRHRQSDAQSSVIERRKQMKTGKWLFFDLGSTLVDESQCYERRYIETITNTQIPYDEFVNKVIEFSKQNLKGDIAAAEHYGLPVPQWHNELERLYPNTKTVLQNLIAKGYRLGIIANQLPGTKLRLRKWGILKYFSVVVSSADEGVSKPDQKVFQRALVYAGCQPEVAVMSGDRLDNDIAPAKRAGMKTVWVK